MAKAKKTVTPKKTAKPPVKKKSATITVPKTGKAPAPAPTPEPPPAEQTEAGYDEFTIKEIMVQKNISREQAIEFLKNR